MFFEAVTDAVSEDLLPAAAVVLRVRLEICVSYHVLHFPDILLTSGEKPDDRGEYYAWSQRILITDDVIC